MKKNEAISILATSVRPREPKDKARYDKAVKMAVDALKEPERKKGKWIYYNPNGFKCSECGGYLEIEVGDIKMKFCPNC